MEDYMTPHPENRAGKRIPVANGPEEGCSTRDRDLECSRTGNEHGESGSIPLVCAKQFQQIEGRLTGIESKLDALISSRTIWAQRIWGIAKALALLLAGWFLGNHRAGGAS